ncbi:endonuclease domain-containing protein [Pseudaminobacter sp. NGMCC 1.201702]|uniref:endonuclease domain-containing protein n=1 Tax=Pseudaminobacter sp. NGMCC 1.201702 TaxID=3391825 RepID=UPI0039F0201B
MAPRSGDGVGAETRSRRKAGTTGRAKKLRTAGNQAEALLWLELKRRKLGGHKFTRQFPIGPYFVDFCCRERSLIVEIDGSQHADSAYDQTRDEFLQGRGYSVLRFWNTDILKHRASVCETKQIDAFDLRYRPAKPQNNMSAADQLTLNQRVRPSPQSESIHVNLDIKP